MADPFIAEIRIFAGNYSPRGWAFCNGQLLPIAQNTALFSLLGATYGGDSQSTFALPDLQGRAPMHPGQGPGLSPRSLGEQGGVESVTLLEQEMPQHTHPLRGVAAPANATSPGGGAIAQAGDGTHLFGGAPGASMAPDTGGGTGGGLPHTNMQPFLTLNYIIALQGVYPQRP